MAEMNFGGKEQEWNTFSTAVTKVLGGAKLAGT